MGNPYNAYTRLEKFNILCGEIIDKYCMELPIADDEIISKYATMILYSLVYSLKEFSNSEKSISDIGKIHKVCKNMFETDFDTYLDSIDEILLISVRRIVYNFTNIEVPKFYAMHTPHKNFYGQIDTSLKKTSINIILNGLYLFDGYILEKLKEI